MMLTLEKRLLSCQTSWLLVIFVSSCNPVEDAMTLHFINLNCRKKHKINVFFTGTHEPNKLK